MNNEILILIICCLVWMSLGFWMDFVWRLDWTWLDLLLIRFYLFLPFFRSNVYINFVIIFCKDFWFVARRAWFVDIYGNAFWFFSNLLFFDWDDWLMWFDGFNWWLRKSVPLRLLLFGIALWVNLIIGSETVKTFVL